MTPLRLKLRNFIGIRSGTGRDEIELDLRHHDGDLVALVGPNGAGKTTIMENLHPYRIMPSRASGYSPGSFSYYDQTTGDALKEFDWSYGGTVYRSTIVIKGAGKTQKQECYLARIDGSRLEPVKLDDGTISDGKAATYDHCVESILGSPELFFTAAFACQGRKTLADYANADIKALMSDLLGLDKIRDLGRSAHEVAKGARMKLEAIRDRLSRADQLKNDRADTAAKLDITVSEAEKLAKHREAVAEQVSVVTQRLAEAQSEYARQADHQRRRDTLQGQIQTATDRMGAAIDQARNNHDAARAEKQKTLSDARTTAERLDRDIETVKARITKNEGLLTRKDEAEQAVARSRELDEEITAAAAKVAEAESAVAKMREVKAELMQISAEGKALRDEHDSLESRCKLTDEVPCQGTDLQGRCKLLGEAMTAKEKLPEKAEALAKARTKRDETKEQLAAMGDAEEALFVAKQAHQALLSEAKDLSFIASLMPAIEQATETLEADRLTLQSYVDQRERARIAQDEADAAIARLDTDFEAQIADTRASHQADIDALRKELDAIPPASADELEAAKQACNEAKAALDRADADLATTNASVATLKERIRNIEQEQESLAGDVERSRKLEDEIAHWSLLAKALGNDGIIALCIDDAGPAITALANELLTTCYGPRFSVSIQTQKETGKGDLKETFDIHVFDAERGDTKSIRDVSGGERVWLNEAMTRAIALFQAQSAGRRYGCLFSDESDGALDAEKKRQFLAMKRKVLELGGYEREIFISHTTELWNAADSVIDVTELSGPAPEANAA